MKLTLEVLERDERLQHEQHLHLQAWTSKYMRFILVQ